MSADGGMSTQQLADRRIEEAICCAVLRDSKSLDKIGNLTPEDFADPVYGEMFAAMQTLREEKLPINTINLRGKGVTSQMGREAIEAVLSKLSFAGEIPNVSDMSRQVVDLSVRRQLMEVTSRYAAAATDGSQTVPALLASLRTEMDTLVARMRLGKSRQAHKEAVGLMKEDLERDLSDVLVPTGIRTLDAMLGGGLRRGDYTVLGGRPGSGKSTLALAIAMGAAKAGRGVLYFTPEMTVNQLVMRATSMAASTRAFPVPYERIMSKGAFIAPGDEGDYRLYVRQKEAFDKAAAEVKPLPIWYDEDTGLMASEMQARVKQAAMDFEESGFRLDLVIVDHMGKVKPTNRYKGNKVQEVGEISEAMAAIGKEDNVAMLALHQLSRGVEGRDNKRPQLSDLRNSGDVEQDADIVMFPYRAAYYLEQKPEDEGSAEEAMRLRTLGEVKNDLEVLVGKNRRGKTGVQKLYCDVSCNLVQDV